MSQENLEFARKVIEWFNARDTAAMQAHSTDDVEIVPLRAAIEDTVYRGPGASGGVFGRHRRELGGDSL